MKIKIIYLFLLLIVLVSLASVEAKKSKKKKNAVAIKMPKKHKKSKKAKKESVAVTTESVASAVIVRSHQSKSGNKNFNDFQDNWIRQGWKDCRYQNKKDQPPSRLQIRPSTGTNASKGQFGISIHGQWGR